MKAMLSSLRCRTSSNLIHLPGLGKKTKKTYTIIHDHTRTYHSNQSPRRSCVTLCLNSPEGAPSRSLRRSLPNPSDHPWSSCQRGPAPAVRAEGHRAALGLDRVKARKGQRFLFGGHLVGAKWQGFARSSAGGCGRTCSRVRLQKV